MSAEAQSLPQVGGGGVVVVVGKHRGAHVHAMAAVIESCTQWFSKSPLLPSVLPAGPLHSQCRGRATRYESAVRQGGSAGPAAHQRVPGACMHVCVCARLYVRVCVGGGFYYESTDRTAALDQQQASGFQAPSVCVCAGGIHVHCACLCKREEGACSGSAARVAVCVLGAALWQHVGGCSMWGMCA